MPYRRRQENVFELTHRLRETHTRNRLRFAPWFAAGACLVVAFAVANSYWKNATGHTLLACYTGDNTPGCEGPPSMKIHGE